MDGVMHPSVEQAIGRDRIRKAFERYENKPSVSFENGTVRTVNADGSYEVLLDNDVQPRTCSAYDTAGVGDRVLVCIMTNGRCMAVSRLEGEDAEFAKRVKFKKTPYLLNAVYLHALNADGELRNLVGMDPSGNMLIGYGLYDNDEGATVLYGGDHINVYSKGGNAINALHGGLVIPANADLNDYMTVGNYYSGNATNSASISNTPYTGGSFSLKVICPYGTTLSGVTVIIQEMMASGGAKYLRRTGDSGATWTPWRRFYGDVELYNNTSGTTGTITLSDSSANYIYLEIFAKTNDGDRYSTRVHSPNGKYVSLIGGRAGTDGTTYLKTKLVHISGTSITVSRKSYSYIEAGNNVCYSENSDGTYITRVVGYR